MPATYPKILLHTIFGTRRRVAAIKPEFQDRLYGFIGGIVRDERAQLLAAGGMPDHVHLLVRWRTDRAVADLMRNVKARSSAWLHQNFPEQAAFAWQEGYGVFSVGQSQVEAVRSYIAQQNEHHRGKTFQEEFVEYLRAYQIDHDPRYIWD